MSVVKGKDLMLFQKKGEKYETLAAATNHTLSISMSPSDSSSKDSGKWGNSEAGRIEWEVGTENLFVQADFDTLFDAMIKGQKIPVAFDIASNADSDSGRPVDGWTIGEGGYEGETLITALNANAPNDGDGTYSATLKGCGELKRRKTV